MISMCLAASTKIIEFKAQGFNSTQLAQLYKLISSDMSDLKIHILYQVTNGDGDTKHTQKILKWYSEWM